MKGVFSIAELIDSSNKYPEKTVFMIMSEDGEHKFNYGQLRSLDAVGDMAGNKNGATGFFDCPELLINHLNSNTMTNEECIKLHKEPLFSYIYN